MRDIKALQLATKKYAVENVYLSWWYVLSTLAIFAGLLTVACLDLPLALRVSASILAGLVTTRFFVIYHDYQHKAILQGSWLAKVIFSVFGMVALNPANIWNRSHNHHHKNNSKSFGASIGSYPLMTTDAYAHAKGWERFRYGLARHPATIALGYLTIFFYGMCLRSLMTNPRRHIDSALSLLLHLTIIAFLAVFAWDIMLLGVIVPSAVAAAVGAYLFYAQHNFPEVKIRERGEWNFVFAALHSSSYMKMGPVMQWFSANIGYHHVHHLNARIPFYRLPEAMEGIEELQTPHTISLHPRIVYRCLQLKLWDIRRDRLVTFQEAAQVA